jgi:DUF971 family protein
MLLDLAAAAMAPAFPAGEMPEELVLQQGGTTLELRFAASPAVAVTADALRAACRCAWCTKARVVGGFPPGFSGLSIQQIKPIGTYAANIVFSDGHDRGVFPWSYLREIATTGN